MKFLIRGLIPSLLAVCLITACTTGNNVSSNSSTDTGAVKQVPTASQVTRVVREEIQYSDGVSAGATIYHYDTKGNLLGEEQLNGKGILVLKKSVVRSSDGKKSIITSTNPAGEVLAINLDEYDADGRLIKETATNAQKEVQSQSEYTYDKKGNMLTWITRGQGQAIIARIIYTVKGMQTSAMEIQDASGQVVKRFSQEFNANGQISAKIEQDASGKTLSRINYGYENGKLIKEDYLNGDAILQRSVTYVYNDKGQAIRVQFLDRKGKLMETRFQEFQVFD